MWHAGVPHGKSKHGRLSSPDKQPPPSQAENGREGGEVVSGSGAKTSTIAGMDREALQPKAAYASAAGVRRSRIIC
jgi:hypothetical protein